MSPRGIVFGLAALALGCASAPRGRDRAGVAVGELLAGAPLGAAQPAVALVDEAEVLAVRPEMRAFLEAHVIRSASRLVRLQQLAHALIRQGYFGLQYDEVTRTASETFHTRRGNCLSFCNMFVAMARDLGLDVYFQEVDTPPDWSLRHDIFVLNRHVNALVDLGRDGEHVVDFNMDDFRTTYDRRRIADERAMAHYDNNLAVERMQAGDTSSALLYFRRALGNDPLFSPAWTNLGILYLKKGHLAHAGAAYLQALKADPGDLVAMSNLASLYERGGDPERATSYRKRVADHRQRNPYFRYQLARGAFLAQDYDVAIGHLKYAVDKKRNEDQFCYLLGLSYLKKGDDATARRWLSRAEEVAANETLKRQYSSKMDMLLSSAPRKPRPK
jgi:Flp pilus assembly protein TadD